MQYSQNSREKLTSISEVQFEVLKRKQAAFLFRKDCKSFGGQIKWVIIYTAVLEWPWKTARWDKSYELKITNETFPTFDSCLRVSFFHTLFSFF